MSQSQLVYISKKGPWANIEITLIILHRKIRKQLPIYSNIFVEVVTAVTSGKSIFLINGFRENP